METIYDNIKNDLKNPFINSNINDATDEELVNFLIWRPWYYRSIFNLLDDFDRRLDISIELIKVHLDYLRNIHSESIYNNEKFLQTYIDKCQDNMYYLSKYNYCYHLISGNPIYPYTDSFLLKNYKKCPFILIFYSGDHPDLIYVKPLIDKDQLIAKHEADLKKAIQETSILSKRLKNIHKFLCPYNTHDKEFLIIQNENNPISLLK